MSMFPLQEEAVFSAGSFWEAEDVFSRLRGVISTDVGYAGGSKSKPSFHDTGDHLEAVRVYFDARIVSYEELLETFWKVHDPTSEMNDRFGSTIYYLTNVQRRIAKESIEKKQQEVADLHTLLQPLGRFWEAEEYHQKYLAKLRGEL